MAKKFYAVRKGNKPGIYDTWSECQAQINGFSGAEYKGFTSLNEADAYINNRDGQEIIEQKIEKTEVLAEIETKKKNPSKKKGIFIDRAQIKDLIISVGIEQWEEFETSDLTPVGNAHRCNIVANGESAMINFYFNGDGTTTLTPTGKNLEISSTIKTLLEERCEFHNSVEAKSFSFRKIPQDWVFKLVGYLESLDGVKVDHKEVKTAPPHDHYQFTSKIGDKLTVNIYKTGTLTLQGKPAYLYSEAIALLSYCEDVSIDDIVGTVNSFHSIDVKTTDVRDELKMLLPRSYGNIDDMVLKLLSPSISLRKVKMELEDYSCYAFPALRALEGYLKYLFGEKGVTVGNSFYGIFNGSALIPGISTEINATDQAELERIYKYLKGNRHVLFHTEQILIGTTILEDKREADEIVNNVLNIIETSYTSINK